MLLCWSKLTPHPPLNLVIKERVKEHAIFYLTLTSEHRSANKFFFIYYYKSMIINYTIRIYYVFTSIEYKNNIVRHHNHIFLKKKIHIIMIVKLKIQSGMNAIWLLEKLSIESVIMFEGSRSKNKDVNENLLLLLWKCLLFNCLELTRCLPH